MVFRPPLCTCRLNWAGRTFWGWWDELVDTPLQTQYSKFKPWRSEAEHASYSWSMRLPTILNFYEWAGKKLFVFLKLKDQSRARARDLRLSKQEAFTTASGPPRLWQHLGFACRPRPYKLPLYYRHNRQRTITEVYAHSPIPSISLTRCWVNAGSASKTMARH